MSLKRRAAAHVIAFMFLGAMVFPGTQGDGCPDPFVNYEDVCTVPNELILLTDGQSRTEVAPFGGRIVFVVDEMGLFTAQLPIARPEELAPIRKSLVDAGFSVSGSYGLELQARR